MIENIPPNSGCGNSFDIPFADLCSIFGALITENSVGLEPLTESVDSDFTSKIKNQLQNILSNKSCIKDNQLHVDDPFTKQEILNGINKLKHNKSCGPDKILNEMIMHVTGKTVLSDALHKLFNTILLTEKMPESWSHGYIIPIHKGGSKNEPSTYRGISITSCLDKLFSTLINVRLTKVIEENIYIYPTQIQALNT